jgi:hypothetical protein
MRDEDVELGLLAWPDARSGCDVHAGIADRVRHSSQRPRGVLDVDDKVNRHLFRARSAYLGETPSQLFRGNIPLRWSAVRVWCSPSRPPGGRPATEDIRWAPHRKVATSPEKERNDPGNDDG